MGYSLQTFVGKYDDLEILIESYDSAAIKRLEQDLCLILLTEDLFNQINKHISSNSIKSFEYLTENLEREILKTIKGKMIAYMEADYFGGQGGQSGVIWKNGKRISYLENDDNAINSILKTFGVISIKGKDEFDTLEFGLLKSDRSWESY